MVKTPCRDCNFYQWRELNAYLNKDFGELRYWRKLHEQHKAECLVINGNWYKLLWQNARVGVDVVPAEEPKK